MLRLRARLPPKSTVATALQTYIANCRKNRRPMTDKHAKLVLQSLRYVASLDDSTLAQNNLYLTTLEVLALRSDSHNDAHRDLALFLYDNHIQKSNAGNLEPSPAALAQCVHVLCSTNANSLARQRLTDYYEAHLSSQDDIKKAQTFKDLQAAWLRVMQGYVDKKQEQSALDTIELRSKLEGRVHYADVDMLMMRYYASIDNLSKAKHSFDKFQRTDYKVLGDHIDSSKLVDVYEVLLTTCLRSKDHAWGKTITEYAVKDLCSKDALDLMLLWAAGTSRGVDEVERMMDTAADPDSPAEPTKTSTVDIKTINRLLRFAIAQKDPYTAERYVAVGRKRNLEPDAETLRLQMEYRLSTDDISGALTAYRELQLQHLSNDDDVPAVNLLICAMCKSDLYDYESIMNVTADLSDRQASLSADAVSALSKLHLSRDEVEDVEDLLETHANYFSFAERTRVRNDLIRLCVDCENTLRQSWRAYDIIHKFFPATDRGRRTTIMLNFFTRGRPDLGLRVFTHMRTHERAESKATIETYTVCVCAIADHRDVSGLQTIHDLLSVDDHVEPNTRLRNAFMLAYTECGGASRALRYWDEIASSREGPNTKSIHLALRACQPLPWGPDKAREIWQRLATAGVELDHELWTSYYAAQITDEDLTKVMSDLEDCARDGKVVIDAYM